MLKQIQSPSLHTTTTAHLAQTMALLELSWDDLRQKIEKELSSNPALELLDESFCPTCHRKIRENSLCPVCSKPRNEFTDQPIIFLSSRSDFIPGSGLSSLEEHTSEEWLAVDEDLPTHILHQIADEISPDERPIVVHILTCLNDDGFLDVPMAEIAQFHHIPLSKIKKLVHLIQSCDPIGVGSNNPQEALLVQLEFLKETTYVPELAFKLIRENMDLLSHRAVLEISRKYNIPLEYVNDTIRFISENLNPFPGRANWNGSTSVLSNPRYIQPDIIISRLNDRPDTSLIVEILSPYAGRLRVNPLFRNAARQAPPGKEEQWQEAVNSASLLVKCLQQRNQALVRLMQLLTVYQREFILNGDESLLPLTRAQVSQELGVHESTISRAVAGKTVQIPNRKIIPLSKMFDRSLHIRAILRQIILQEKHPLSDSELADLLEQKGYPVARRTVAKYRAIEGIMPARYRQTLYKSP
jgi:RNA polymerase sigma-54 factor